MKILSLILLSFLFLSSFANADTPDSTLIHPPQEPPPGAKREFSTDFSRHTVPYRDVFSGGPPKDGIPAIDNPKFISVEEADGWLDDREPVLLAQEGEVTHIYPVQILMSHEIVNDEINGVPVAVTYCPLCNTGIGFSRIKGDQVLDFGTTGRLRFSNLVMYDRQTETWWQQASGEGIAGLYAGDQLDFVPVLTLPWKDAKEGFQKASVLSRDTGYFRSYGRNPYYGYDTGVPFLYRGDSVPDEIPMLARVVNVEINGEVKAYPYFLLEADKVVEDTVGGTTIVIFWSKGTASALDSAVIADGRDVGSANVFLPVIDGTTYSFRADGDIIIDNETQSRWNIAGFAVDGPLAGKRLTPVAAIQHFWFSSWAFNKDILIQDE